MTTQINMLAHGDLLNDVDIILSTRPVVFFIPILTRSMSRPVRRQPVIPVHTLSYKHKVTYITLVFPLTYVSAKATNYTRRVLHVCNGKRSVRDIDFIV